MSTSRRTARHVATDFPSLREFWAIRMTLVRSSILGTVLGIVPGAGATITSFIAYGIEKQYGRRRPAWDRHPGRHRRAANRLDGVGCWTHDSTAYFGSPGSGATAVILGAFLLHGVQPGPLLFSNPARGSGLHHPCILVRQRHRHVHPGIFLDQSRGEGAHHSPGLAVCDRHGVLRRRSICGSQ